METTRQDYQDKMEGQLRQLSARLDGLRVKAQQVGAEAKTELLAEIAKLEKLDANGRQQLATVKTIATHTWHEVKTNVTDKWNHVSGAANAIWAHARGK